VAHHAARHQRALLLPGRVRRPLADRAVVRGLYLADSEDTAWAEWLRATAEQGAPPASRLPRAMCPLEVDLDGIAGHVDRDALRDGNYLFADS